jgi:hypothetical protein
VSKSERRLEADDPIVIDLIQRVTRLEERTSALERDVTYIKSVLEKVDSRIWYIIVGIAVSILTQILLRVT